MNLERPTPMPTPVSRPRRVQKATVAAVLLLGSMSATAAFTTFVGGATEEAQWRVAAGTTNLEDFQSFAPGAQINALPQLGVEFDELDGGGFPQINPHFEANTPYGQQHLGNFPNGVNEINRFDDIVMLTESGMVITAFGFYNGDGQLATMVASAYDAQNNLLGSVGAFKGAFAGVLSSVPIARVVFGGQTGDGWNHIDGLQTNAVRAPTTVSEPSILSLIGIAFGLGAVRRLSAKRLDVKRS